MRRLWRGVALLVVAWMLGIGNPAMAEDPLQKATDAVTGILFDYDASQFVTYTINEKGFADVSFANNTPDPLYSEIVNKLADHPDIKGVLPGKNGPSCSLFSE